MALVLIELLRGKGSHVDPLACIEDLSLDIAARRVAGFPHSIFDLVFHMNYWMRYELRRIRGERPPYPEHNAESFPSAPTNEAAWEGLRSDLSGLLDEFAMRPNDWLRMAAFVGAAILAVWLGR